MIEIVVAHRIDTDERARPRVGTVDDDELLALVVEARLDRKAHAGIPLGTLGA